MKGKVRGFRILAIVCVLFISLWVLSISVKADELQDTTKTEEKNTVYDALKEKIQESWDKGMSNIEECDPINITGNFIERTLRMIAAICYKNIKSIKAGSLLIGLVSFLMGSILAILSKSDKKMRKKAIGIGMAAIPAILLLFVFGISWYISIFR